MKNDVVIIGAGHAGGMAAISLRQRKYQGSIGVQISLITLNQNSPHSFFYVLA